LHAVAGPPREPIAGAAPLSAYRPSAPAKARLLDTLAAIQAANHAYPLAVQTLDQALAVLDAEPTSPGTTPQLMEKLRDELQQRRELYASGRSFQRDRRQPSPAPPTWPAD
jgi:hypothetical protein